jgi:hypothetical protein
MAHSKNDYHRNKYDRDEEYNYRNDVHERNQHRRDKRITNALRSRDVNALLDDDEE